MSQDYIVKESWLKGVADSIRGHKGTTEPILADSFASEIEGIQSGGGENKFVQLAERTIIKVTAQDLQGATQIGDRAFSFCDSLEEAELPSGITSIGSDAFYNCSLRRVILPSSVKSIMSRAFGSTKLSGDGVYISDIGAWINIDFEQVDANPVSQSKKLYLKNASGDYELVTNLVIPNTVTEIKKHVFCYCYPLETVQIPSSVTSIGLAPFDNCTNFKGVYISDIGTWCNVDIYSANSNPLYNAKRLYLKNASGDYELVTNLVIPNTVTEIKKHVLYGLKHLFSVDIPDGVTSIGTFSLGHCRYRSITIPSSVTTIGSSAISNNSYLEKVTLLATEPPSISADSFNNTPNNVAFEVPAESVEKYKSATNWSVFADRIVAIGESREFSEGLAYTLNSDGASYSVSGNGTCTDHGLHIPSSYEGLPVTNIGNSAFSNFSSKQHIRLPNTITTIGSSAFANCAFDTIEIPNSVVEIGSKAFSGNKIASLLINDITAWCNIEFGDANSVPLLPNSAGVSYLKNSLGEYKPIVNLIVPSEVTEIKNYAFRNHSNLTTVSFAPDSQCTRVGQYSFYDTKLTTIEIPNSVTILDYNAFGNCKNLTTVTFAPDSQLTTLANLAFYYCNSLESITLPSSIKNFVSSPFTNCPLLKEITILATTPPNMSGTGFVNLDDDFKIYVPAESVDAYKSATNWSTYADRIMAIKE